MRRTQGLFRHFFLVLTLFLFSGCASSVSPRNHHLALEHYMSGLRNLGIGKLQDAYWDFEYAAHLDPTMKKVHYALGHVYYRMHDFQDAKKEFRLSMQGVVRVAAAYNYLGLIAYKQRQYHRAIRYFQKALSDPLYKTPEHPLVNMGRTYIALNKPEKARETFSLAILRNSNDVAAHFWQGKLLMTTGDYKGALEEFSEVIRLAPRFPRSYYELGRVYLKLENQNKALLAFKEVVRLDPDSPESVKARQYIKKLP
ncbi:MAG: Putative TPR-domain containing protein [Leptospirillum sp. Group II 'C75']|uniref:tetratricopeptide repeat protein n=1 Tax=Leptospirillum sp. Group II 'CF-1' TaxID=1660083 RepID=UPI0000F0CE58|nr:tetratricopeptide repeat protein [Leptospirillum sp. Group II 'CF-1']EAY55739.1 MAG: putative TPR-domain containing protein [Leptospirillum rubarum]EIJ75768.1 MAG: Putative TPR-domain containing protein [Leptospirillum sp. Group II 'C75']